MDEIWKNINTVDYKKMEKRHPKLWEYIKNYIKNNNIKSVLDVGGGDGLLGGMGLDYTILDFNPNINPPKDAELIKEDFLEVDVADIEGKHQLVLICNVIEHNPVFLSFFLKAMALMPEHIIISFFFGLNRDKNKNALYKSKEKGECKLKLYSEKYIRECMEKIGEVKRCKIIVLNEKHSTMLIWRRDGW